MFTRRLSGAVFYRGRRLAPSGHPSPEISGYDFTHLWVSDPEDAERVVLCVCPHQANGYGRSGRPFRAEDSRRGPVLKTGNFEYAVTRSSGAKSGRTHSKALASGHGCAGIKVRFDVDRGREAAHIEDLLIYSGSRCFADGAVPIPPHIRFRIRSPSPDADVLLKAVDNRCTPDAGAPKTCRSFKKPQVMQVHQHHLHPAPIKVDRESTG
jgi:hypothetical protein